ncbi:MAG: hypothetical protein N3F06_03975 [Nitrososphaerales archaeon]|nr:hypothetical protein [Nitrososphaerales archaeon]
MYCLCKAIYEFLGEDAWKVVWRSGEILFKELEERLNLKNEKDYVKTLQRLAQYLQESGYVEHINVNRLLDEMKQRRSEEELIVYEMVNPALTKWAERLTKEGGAPAHISTGLLLAALKKYGLKGEMVEGPVFLPDGRVIEKWKITTLR